MDNVEFKILPTVTYAITVCNELEEITKLLNFLLSSVREEDEVLVQYDSESVTDQVREYLSIVNKMHDNLKITGYPLNKDFASFKNNLTSLATKDFIFQIDADEMPHENLIFSLPEILSRNKVDLVFIPRVNTVKGITEEHVKKWNWKVDENGWLNWPDYQTRIYRRTDDILWMGEVHERITGFSNFTNFPAQEKWALYHHKEIDKQEKQNAFYDTIQ